MAGIEIATGELVKVIVEELVPNRYPCQARRINKYYNDTPKTDYRCKRNAKYRINGKLLCTRHAEVVSLHILLNGDN